MNRNAFQSILLPLIGFRPDAKEQLTEELKASSIGQFVDQHPLLTTARLKLSCPKGSTFPQWLEQQRLAAVNALLNLLIGKLQTAGLMPRLARPGQILCESAIGQPITKKPLRRVGLALTPLQDDVLLTLSRIKLSLTGVLPNIRLYLYEEFVTEELAHFDLAQTSVTKWHDAVFPVLEVGKTYWLLYDEDTLAGVQAKNTITTYPTSAPTNCKNCGNSVLTEYLQVQGVALDGFGNAEIDETTNFGLNLMLRADGDTTDRLLDKPMTLLPAYAAQLEETLLKQVAFSERHNGQAEEDTQGAIFQLFDKDNKATSAGRAERELDKLVAQLLKDSNKALQGSDDYIEVDSL